MIKILEKSLLMRKVFARLITVIRNNKFLKTTLKRIFNKSVDAWAATKDENQYKELVSRYTINFEALIKGNKRKIGLVALKGDEVCEQFINACNDLNLSFQIFDPEDEAFLEEVKSSDIRSFLIRPSHKTQLIRQMFLEKVDILVEVLGKAVYPTLKEQKVYEAKRVLSYFLQANNIPHPKTWVFYSKKEAIDFVANAFYPIVFKTHNGASASGVEVIKNKKQALRLIKTTFNSYYLNKAVTDFRDIDYGYILFQEFIKDAREYRVIKIGDSWFGHEKEFNGSSEFMSGSGVNLWTVPRKDVFDFCYKIATKHSFTTMAFDIFEDKSGNLFVNELQTWFGSYNPSQMYLNKIPGRFIYEDGEFRFEEGLFNQRQSLSLRIVDMLNSPHFDTNEEKSDETRHF